MRYYKMIIIIKRCLFDSIEYPRLTVLQFAQYGCLNLHVMFVWSCPIWDLRVF